MAKLLQFLSSLAWPGAVIVLALIFRPDLSEAVKRVKKAGIAGVELADQQTVAPPSQFETSGELKPLPPQFRRTPAIAEIEKSIHSSLNVFKSEDRVDLLVSELATTRMTRHFESVWGLIFESQIKALQAADSADGTAQIEQLRPLFDAVDYVAEFTFEEWVQFPVGQFLATRSADGFAITDLGREFLAWLPLKGALRRPA